MDLNAIWFWLVGVLIIGYAILDGFDLGVGVLHLFTRSNDERRILLNAIGPVWDGNEVWLLTGGGALFAAFPVVYATVFSGFYTALMLLLAALIFRAVSLEFRGKVDGPRWRTFWDWAFGLGSLLPALLFGVAYGNILRGVPIDRAQAYGGSFIGLLNPYSLLVGLLSLVLFTMHGALYLTLKTDGDLLLRVRRWSTGAWIVFVVLYALTTIASLVVSPWLFEGTARTPVCWVLCLLLVAATIGIKLFVRKARYFMAFLSSSLVIASAIGLSALGLFPRMVPSSTDLAFSLTIYNASSSEVTLSTMLTIALLGMPLVILYTVFIYRQFKGKVVIGNESY
jgi:cytochrome bd ubiquinol oxidase subunit II